MTLSKRKACFLIANNNNININQLISHLFFNINFYVEFSVPLITMHKNHGIIWISTEKV